jgi:2-polyprenyl-3-methyl-5-hydroxy-6-metoxy-1,4-benzoquinol methylase
VSSESERLRSSWIANSTAWQEAVREDRIESRRVATNAAIVSAIVDRKPRRVLDLGCGEGWLARELSGRGISVTGIDASEPLVTAAQALGGGEFAVRSYEEITADPASLGQGYEVVVANFSLLDQDLDDLARTLRTLLSSEGVLIVQTVHPIVAAGDSYTDGWRTETFATMPGDWPEPMPWYFRTLGSWTRLFTTAGFTIVEIREPMDPRRGVPASIIFVCTGSSGTDH